MIDNDGNTGSKLLAISPAELPPLPAFTWRCVQLSCVFDGHLSVDNGAAIAGYAWNFGDSHNAAGAEVAHTYSSVGPRTVTLTIVDASATTAHVSAPVDANAFTNVGTSIFTFGSHYSVNGVYRPFTGDFNGDGKTDIFWYAPGQTTRIWYATANGFVQGPSYTIHSRYQPLVGDFDGNGYDDIFWYATAPSDVDGVVRQRVGLHRRAGVLDLPHVPAGGRRLQRRR